MTADDNYEIPWLCGRDGIDVEDPLYQAALTHIKPLTKATGCLAVALDMAHVLRGFFTHKDTSLAYRADTVVRQIQKRADRARDLIDDHGTDNKNLFIAYIEECRNHALTKLKLEKLRRELRKLKRPKSRS